VSVTLTDPVRVWLGSGSLDLYQELERGMWPDRAGELHAVNRYNLTQADLLTAAQVARVWMRRRRLEAEVAQLHAEVDVVLTPTTAVAPFPAEGPIPEVIAGQSVFPAMAVPFTMVANLCWNPAASVPAGLTAVGLPVGLQIQARRHADELVLRLARLLELARPWPALRAG
jgi:aspartyl-tRNA(Asn)/glutamyl-tRNA(Gln) amidotransferase subunit A